MTANHSDDRQPQPDEQLRALDRLVGRWRMSGDVTGETRYSWLDGGFFLRQDVDVTLFGQHVTGIEIIGREKPFGVEQPGEDIKARFYDNQGNTLDYIYELDGDTVTIWGGEKGSPAYFRGEFSADGTTLAGDWVWPGGGYHAVHTKVD
ncbi:hypothetical protein [Haloechinothrix sp. LS1_15]|uniref:hypothetical protein n=1 Tax=Haloechinothrix sp. LS1_15 TaxID=2652248 RepID=UPI0029456616|nr:hypothetical protein [Haloechinothrix sp. LS1_15]MDV6011937.1 hypothetical protein [Haloechinothrix sp. LS1_15]